MSQAAVEQIFGRLVMDREFRELMQTDLQTALAGYNLTPEEREGFTNIDLHEFNQVVADLDERVSKASLN